MNKTKILIVMGGSYMGVGGIESMVINYYRHLDKNSLQIDFVFFGYGEGLYDDEILQNGGRIFHLPIKSKHPIKSRSAMKKLLTEEKYDVVHANLNAAGIYSALKIAKKCKIPTRISHAHSTNHGTLSKLRWLINDFARKRITKYSTDNFACSDLAGDWYYPNKPYAIVPNAINTSAFLFNDQIRCEIRTDFGCEESFVIGHVGNLGYPKNQSFLLDVFYDIRKKCSTAKLWLIGEGEDLCNLQEKANTLGIAEHVRFLGKRNDVNKLLQAMDVFVLPSFFEGFPVVITEAIASDLPCIISDTVTKMVAFSDKVKMLNINGEIEDWSNSILQYMNNPRRDNYELIVKSNFDISTEAIKLQKFYQKGRFE